MYRFIKSIKFVQLFNYELKVLKKQEIKICQIMNVHIYCNDDIT